MLDYEVSHYTVHYVRPFAGKYIKRSRKFLNEEEAAEFIKEHRHNWTWYKLEQTRTAIIDF